MQAPELGLRVRQGSDPDPVCRLDLSPLSIGSSSANDLTVRDPLVSRRHCQVTLRDGHYWVHDLASTNGTYLDGQRVAEARLTLGSTLRIGGTELSLVALSKDRASDGESVRFGEMVGRSEPMRQLFAMLHSVADTPLTCLIFGPTGTGKELAAKALHDHSRRRERPFMVVDCGAVGAQFIEAKLFGYQRGAFTGAHEAMPGVFESAKGGTVFLDEIGELPLELQPKLLGVLERREAVRIGSHTPVKLDVRVIAATHRNLPEMVAEGSFRQDLLYRLGELSVRIPPLAERREDIEPLARAIIERESPASRLSDDALSYLLQEEWPGNVRELRNTLRRAAILAKGGRIDRAVLERIALTGSVLSALPSAAPALLPPVATDSELFALSFEEATEAFRSRYVHELRRKFWSDLQGAAAHAGLHPKSVSRLFRMYGVY